MSAACRLSGTDSLPKYWRRPTAKMWKTCGVFFHLESQSALLRSSLTFFCDLFHTALLPRSAPTAGHVRFWSCLSLVSTLLFGDCLPTGDRRIVNGEVAVHSELKKVKIQRQAGRPRGQTWKSFFFGVRCCGKVCGTGTALLKSCPYRRTEANPETKSGPSIQECGCCYSP